MKIWLGAVTIVGILALMLGSEPSWWATSYRYLDLDSGLVKDEYVCFGRVYSSKLIQTEYSELLRKYKIDTRGSTWCRANAREIGLRYLIYPAQHSYSCGAILSDLRSLSIWLKSVDMSDEEIVEILSEMRALLVRRDFQRVETRIREIMSNVNQ